MTRWGTSTITEDATGTGPRTTTIQYDRPTASRTSVTRYGQTTHYGYDSEDELTSITDPMGNETSSATPTARTCRTSVRTPTGRPHLMAIPSETRLATDPDGNTTRTTSTGRSDGLGDRPGRAIRRPMATTTSTTSPRSPTQTGRHQLCGYDNDGDLTSLHDAKQNTTQFHYNQSDRAVDEPGRPGQSVVLQLRR